MTKIAVLVDSSSNLTATEVAELEVFMVNAPIMAGESVYHENESWAELGAFYDLQRTSTVPLTTSQIEPGIWLEKFDEIAAAGYTDVLVVTISSGVSGTFDTVQSLAQTVDTIHVHAWDSKIAAAGAGNQARLAAKMALAGHTVAEISAALTELRASTQVLFVVDDIKHLQRTGRISGGTALIGSLLNIKPLLTFEDGKIIAIGQERMMKRAWMHIKRDFDQAIKTATTPLLVSVIDANNGTLGDRWAAEIEATYPHEQVRVVRGPIGPYISVHTGEKAMGFIWSADLLAD